MTGQADDAACRHRPVGSGPAACLACSTARAQARQPYVMPAKAPAGAVVPLDCTQPAMTAPGFGRASTRRRGRLSVSQRGLGALSVEKTTAATPPATTTNKGDQVMEKAKAKAQEIKDGTVGKGFLYRTVEQAKG